MVLGDSGRLGTVKGICSFGQNFTMREIKEYGQSLVTSVCPTFKAPSLAHLISLFPLPLLGVYVGFPG